MAMDLSLEPALSYDIATLAQLLNRSFADYLVDIRLNPTLLSQMIQREGIDLSQSQLILRRDKAIGIALIARRGWTCRLAAMGLISESRGQGIGTWFLKDLVTQASLRGEHTMMLEVIEQNRPAVRLYEAGGFASLRRLVGYKASKPVGQADDRLHEIDLRTVGHRLIMVGQTDLPWQISGESLAHAGPPNRGYQLGPAYAAISNPDRPQININAVVVAPEAQRQGWASRLLQALMACYPDRIWRVPILWPAEIAPGFFEQLGFVAESLTQLQMSLDLTIPSRKADENS